MVIKPSTLAFLISRCNKSRQSRGQPSTTRPFSNSYYWTSSGQDGHLSCLNPILSTICKCTSTREGLAADSSVDSFFNLVPSMPRLLHRSRLLARLALPPTHSNHPHPALVHAICAAAAAWCESSVYERSSRANWLDGTYSDDKTETFASRQIAACKEAVQSGLDSGNRLFDVVRAMIILGRVFIDDTRWVLSYRSEDKLTR